jgi:hypothetical protein
MAKLEAFYNFAEDVSTGDADLGLLQLMNELRGPPGSSLSRDQSNSEGMMWPQSANFDRPAQSSSASARSSHPALDQSLDDWLEQGLRDNFAQAALHHMRFVVEDHVEFGEESRQRFVSNSPISSSHSVFVRVPFPGELGPSDDVLRRSPAAPPPSTSAAQPVARDCAVSIASKSLHSAFFNYIQSLSRPGSDKMNAVMQLAQNVRDPLAWLCTPPASAVPGSFRNSVFEHLAEILPASMRNAGARALLPLRRFYPAAGSPCLVRVTQAYEPGPAEGNHLRLQVGDHLLLDPQILDVSGFRLGRLINQPLSAFQVFPTAHTKFVCDVAHLAVAASESAASASILAGNNPCQDYLHGIEVSNRLLSASISRLSLVYSQMRSMALGSKRLDGRRVDAVPFYLALRGHTNFVDFGSILVRPLFCWFCVSSLPFSCTLNPCYRP